jgi:hypothetical protein
MVRVNIILIVCIKEAYNYTFIYLPFLDKIK